jgi:signal recognition particle subunit SRP72
MASNPTATLTSLLKGSTIEDHEEVLKAANAVLKSSKNNQDALHTRVVALLKLDRFDDALRALDDGGDKLAHRCILEKAYALYKTGKFAEAERLAEGASGRGLKHVAAQVAYREEKFEDAARIYKELAAQTAEIEGEENDLRINGAAVDAQLEWQGNGDKVEPSRKKPGREDLEAFETSYNAACGCIARGDLATGSMLLKRARDLCEGLDELSDEEKRAEVLPIMVQQAYVFTKLGKLEEADALQKMINIAEYVLVTHYNIKTNSYSVPEPPTRVIAQNNALAASTDSDNPYMTQRIFDSGPTLSHTEKHFEHQSSILQRNRYTIDLQSGKYSGVAHSTSIAISKATLPTISPLITTLSVLNSAAHTQTSTSKSSIKKLLPLLTKRPHDIGLLLTIIHLHLLTSSPSAALTLLETFLTNLSQSPSPTAQDARFAPGVTALLISLYRLVHRKAPIKTALANAAAYWRSKAQPSTTLLCAAGISLLDSATADDLAQAGDIFASLRTQDPKDKLALAGFVAAYASTDYAKVVPDLGSLPPITSLVSGIDAAALEDAGIPTLAPPTTPASKKRAAGSDGPERGVKKRKITKSKMPKEFEEGKVMDPERWLPLRDRSSYRPKGRKGKKKAAELTQGGAVKADEGESLELAGGAGSVKVEKAGVGGGAKKKGKKGKK